jgi:hypothetical protein
MGAPKGKAQPPISPREGLGYFLRENIDILASSGMQGLYLLIFSE